MNKLNYVNPVNIENIRLISVLIAKIFLLLCIGIQV